MQCFVIGRNKPSLICTYSPDASRKRKALQTPSRIAAKTLFVELRKFFAKEEQFLPRDINKGSTFARTLRNHFEGIISAISDCFRYEFYESSEDKIQAQATLMETEGKLELLQQILQKYKDLQS